MPLRAALEDTVQRGHDGIRQLARDIAESWSEAQIEILDFEVRGEQALLSAVCASGNDGAAH